MTNMKNRLKKKLLAGLTLALWLPTACGDVEPVTDTSDARKAELCGEAIDAVVHDDHEVVSMVALERAAQELDVPHLRELQVQIIERVGWDPTPKQVEEALQAVTATYSESQLHALREEMQAMSELAIEMVESGEYADDDLDSPRLAVLCGVIALGFIAGVGWCYLFANGITCYADPL